MSTIYDTPVQMESGQRSPYEPWPGLGGPAARAARMATVAAATARAAPVRRTGRRLLMAAVAVLVGGSTFVALQATGSGTAGRCRRQRRSPRR